MANIFFAKSNEELLNRLENLSPTSERIWGTMNVSQMLFHCRKPMEVCDGKLVAKRSFLGILFGKSIKRKFLQSKYVKKHVPTLPEFVANGDYDFVVEKEKIRSEILRYLNLGPEIIVNTKHPFFGNMTSEEWGILHYKHLDHHFKQFGV